MKICATCGEEKLTQDFWKQGKSPDGLQYSCKQCQNERLGVKGSDKGRPRNRREFAVICDDCGPTTTTVFRFGKCCRCYERARKAGWIPKRSCSDCGQDIGNRPPQAIYCEPCGRQRQLDTQRGYDYGMSGPEFRQLVERTRVEQEGRCAICRKEMADLHFDHIHETGHFRGLLCGHCNRGLGHFFDDPEVLIAAAAYLISNSGKLSSEGEVLTSNGENPSN